MRVHAPEVDRVRANTWPQINDRLDLGARLRLRRAAAGPDVLPGLARLDNEWDIERAIELEASTMGLAGLALALGVDRRFLLLPGMVSTMLLVHAWHGWYPLLPLFRRLRFRTQDEIDRERYALKALRGDFDEIPPAEGPAAERAAAAWRAVCR